MFKRWREKLAYLLIKKQTSIDLSVSYDKLPSDILTEAYSIIYNTSVISDLFKFLIKNYDKKILELANFTFNPMTTPNQMDHFFLRKFVEMKSLKAKKDILTHFLVKGKEYQKVISMRKFKEDLKKPYKD